MQNPTLQAILKNTFTKSDFYRRIDLVQEYLARTVYTVSESGDPEISAAHCAEYARQNGRANAAPYIVEWGDSVLSALTTGNFYDNIKNLKKVVEDLPELVLYVPVQLDDEGIFGISAWCRENLDGQAMLNILIESDSVGGCTFVWNGQYHDFSLGYFLDQNQEEVSKLIHAYDGK